MLTSCREGIRQEKIGWDRPLLLRSGVIAACLANGLYAETRFSFQPEKWRIY
jgi:hypothetical protein